MIGLNTTRNVKCCPGSIVITPFGVKMSGTSPPEVIRRTLKMLRSSAGCANLSASGATRSIEIGVRKSVALPLFPIWNVPVAGFALGSRSGPTGPISTLAPSGVLTCGAPTRAIAVELLLFKSRSTVVVVTRAVLVINVSLGTSLLTVSARLKIADAPAGKTLIPQEMLPPPPGCGAAQLQPCAADRDLNTVLAGTASVSVTFAAAAGPELSTLSV